MTANDTETKMQEAHLTVYQSDGSIEAKYADYVTLARIWLQRPDIEEESQVERVYDELIARIHGAGCTLEETCE